MDRLAWLFAGVFAAASLALFAFHADASTAVTLAPGIAAAAAVVLAVQRMKPRLDLAALGALSTLLLAVRTLALEKGPLLLIALAGLGALATVLGATFARAREPRQEVVPFRAIAAALAAFALGLGTLTPGREVLAIVGTDAPGAVAVIATWLAAAGLGAWVTRFLLDRHPRFRPLGAPLLALAAAAALAIEIPPFDEVLARARSIQGPSVTRSHFLYGGALLAGSVAGAAIFCLGALCQSVVIEAPRRIGLVAAAVAGSAAPFAAGAYGVPFAMISALLAGAAASPRRSPRVACVIGAAITLGLASRWSRVPNPTFVLEDPIRQFDGRPVPPDVRGRAGRPARPDPPGWPFLDLDRGLHELESALGILGPPSMPELFADVRTVPAEEFAQPLLDESRHWRDGREGPPFQLFVIDLAELTFDEVRAAAGAIVRTNRRPVTFLHGRHAIFVCGNDSAPRRFDPLALDDGRLRAVAQPPGPVYAFSREATAALADVDRPTATLLLRRGRTRLSHRRWDLAATNLRALTRRADRLGPDDPLDSPNGTEARVRLELCAAILDDDAKREVEMLQLLARSSSDDAARLGRERAAARDAILEFLLAARDEDPSNADTRHRLGRVLRGRGDVAAAIDELTRTAELRPKLEMAAVELADAFVDAELAGYRKWTPRGPLESLRQVWAVQRAFLKAVDDPDVVTAWEQVVARVGRIEADREDDPAEAERLRRGALGRYRLGFLHDAYDVDAHREYAETLRELDIADGQLRRILDLTRIDPLDARVFQLLAAYAQSRADRTRALAASLRLSAAAPPTSSTSR